MSPKKLGKSLVCNLLEIQAKRLLKKNNFRIVAIIGSVGKTSTKLAIAKTLDYKLSVVYQDGNYNDRLTVPLVLFNHIEPNIFNVFAWLWILFKNEWTLLNKYPYDIAILELGTDAPGQLAAFSYLKPDLTVLTAIAAEHMEYFGDLDAVAKEELVLLDYSKQVLLNIDNIPKEYIPSIDFKSYGTSENADYRLTSRNQDDLASQQLEIRLNDTSTVNVKVSLVGAQGAIALLAAAAVAHIFDCSEQDIKTGLEQLASAPGRMQVLHGVHDTKLIDDTYNASPIAVKAALDVLFATEAPQRIAILGSMNELGQLSESEHEVVGSYCDPRKLNTLITIGNQAEKYLAPAAKARGCNVVSFNSPYEAGNYVRDILHPGAIVLAKGSQNGVFAEEAVKVLLQNPEDETKLVRQSPNWLNKKKQQFKTI